ncbi:HAMP domain-containing protein [Kamptonema formosum]|uniref:HAMP domain-containing protein n=1 Tax=Kamptonema formosum TaxID=331992 RepID=UPI00034A828E|nr:hypothetical protein [Oscillatoria sp. PCC 10802]
MLANRLLLSALAQFQRQFQAVIWTVLGTVLVTFSLCACVSLWFSRRIATPIQAMRNFAIRLEAGHLGDKLNIPQNDDFADLTPRLILVRCAWRRWSFSGGRSWRMCHRIGLFI